MIIGMNFLKAIKTTILSHLGGLLIMDRERLCFVTCVLKDKKNKDVMLSTHWVTQGLKHGNPTFVASLLEVKDDLVCEIHTFISDDLKEFQDIVPPELPCTLPLRWAANHQIRSNT